jgi:vacuolar-type H+-ATPase subunit E/Vma4
MENEENLKDKGALISSIEHDAVEEAEKIVGDALKQAEERKMYAEKRITSILEDAEGKSSAQSEAVRKKVLAGVEMEIKRRLLQVREVVFSEILARVKDELKRLIGRETYRRVLMSWITEAMIGLGTDSAVVSASREEMHLIDAELLIEVEKKVKKYSGKEVKLRLSNGQYISSQGVVLTSGDGRTAFNNLVTTRLLRKQGIIRTLIYEKLFTEEG